MIRLGIGLETLDACERFGLRVWLDAARIIAVDDPDADVVQLRVQDVRDPSARTDAIASVNAVRSSGLEVGDGFVAVRRETLRAITRLVSAADEQRSTARDRYGRVPPGINAMVQARGEDDPVVSRAAQDLRRAVIAAAGRRVLRFVTPWPQGKRWAVGLTHDLDVVALWPLFSALRVLELTRAGELADAARAIAAAATSVVGGRPTEAGVEGVVASDGAAPAAATWFILCGTPSARSILAGDLTYRIDSSPARRILERLMAAGDEVGLHGSFATSDDVSGSVFASQRMRLGEVSGRGDLVTGVRQHFLRMRPGATQRAMVAAGFAYDATFGFSDRNGFRLGIADVVDGWDAVANRAIDLIEVPLMWMDRALSKYQRIENPEVWTAAALTTAEACRAVDGLWVGLWHPNLTPALGYPRVRDTYRALVRELAQRDPYFGSLGDIVRWRRARRLVRAVRVHDDARIEWATPAGSPTTAASRMMIDVEDANGIRIETVEAAC